MAKEKGLTQKDKAVYIPLDKRAPTDPTNLHIKKADFVKKQKLRKEKERLMKEKSAEIDEALAKKEAEKETKAKEKEVKAKEKEEKKDKK